MTPLQPDWANATVLDPRPTGLDPVEVQIVIPVPGIGARFGHSHAVLTSRLDEMSQHASPSRVFHRPELRGDDLVLVISASAVGDLDVDGIRSRVTRALTLAEGDVDRLEEEKRTQMRALDQRRARDRQARADLQQRLRQA